MPADPARARELRRAIDTAKLGARVADVICPIVPATGSGGVPRAACRDRRLSTSPDSMYSAIPGKAAANRAFAAVTIRNELSGYAMDQLMNPRDGKATFDVDLDDLGSVPDHLLAEAIEQGVQARLLLLAHVAGREMRIIKGVLSQMPRGELAPQESGALRLLDGT